MRVIAHRGALLKAPENSMEAFMVAASEGAHGIECDVQVSADGCLFICHDDDTSCTASESLIISSSSSQRIRELRLENAEPIPRMADVLEWWTHLQRPLWWNFEIKGQNPHAVASLSDLMRPLSESQKTAVVISSRHQDMLRCMRDDEVLSSFLRAWVVDGQQICHDKTQDQIGWWEAVRMELNHLKVGVIHPQATFWTDTLNGLSRADGFCVNTWSSACENELLSDQAIWQQIIHWNVDGHCTNMPLEFSQFLRQSYL